jgi:PAS domain S-box-containing protein
MVESGTERARRLPPWVGPLTIGAVLAVATVTGVWAWIERQEAHATEHWRGQLSAMAEDRRGAIEAWVRERLGDARTVAAYPTTVYLASGRGGPPFPFPSEQGARGHLTQLLRSAQEFYGYEAGWLLGSGPGAPVLASTTAAPPDGGLIERVLGRGAAEIDFRSYEGRAQVVVAAPVRAKAGDRPIGVVLLAADPRSSLFRLLSREPLPTRTGESLLVRREGADVVFLSPLRHGPARLRRPVETERLAAAAALQGREAFGTFRDYRGTFVLAAVRPIQSTGWGLVVKVDRDEALEAARTDARRAAATFLALLLAFSGVGFGLWRQHVASARIALARSEARFGLVLEQAGDAILFVRPDGRIAKANRRAEELYGCPRAELESLRIHDLCPPDRVPGIEARMAAVRRQSALVYETEHRARDGTALAVEVSSRYLEAEGLFFSIVRDIRERRATEERIAFLNRTLRTLSEVNQLMVREPDRERFLQEACRIVAEHGGFRMAWIGFRDPQTDWIVPVSWAGHEDGYLSQTWFSADESSARGKGPSGRAVREGRTVIVTDIQAEASLTPWHEAALERGYRGACATPIRVHGALDAVLALYTGQSEVFTPEVIQLVEELAADIGFAVENAEARLEREAAVAALAESKRFLETLIDSASAAIFTLHPDGRVGSVWNPAAERLFGWSREEVVGRPAPLVPPDRQEEFRSLRQLILEGRYLTNLEVTRVRRDGTPVELSLAASPLRDSSGRIVSILAVAVDITERKQAQAALQASEDRFKRLAENAPDVIYRHRLLPSPRTEYVSPAVRALAGYAPEEFYENPELIARVIHPDDRHLLDEAVRGEIPSAKPVLVRWLRRDGTTLWAEIRNVLVRDEQGALVALEGISRDVTERMEAERTVRRLSAAIEQSPVAIVITDSAGTIEYLNPAFCRQTGYSREEALGQNPRILKSGHHPKEFYAELYATIGSGREWRGEMLNRRKDGELYWEYASISPIVDEQGCLRHYLAVKEDITERKKAEEALRRAQDQLLQSQKLEAVGRLAGGVAHDFNNLLGVIIGHGELAQLAANPGDALQNRLEQILGAARRAADLTRQLLAFSRRQVLQPRVLDLNAEVADMERMLRRLIGEDIELVTRLDPELGRVRADPGQIGQVLMNLAVNARDAMPRGGVLTIATSNVQVDEAFAKEHAAAVPGPHVQLVVADDGAGMEEAVREHLFEPFFTTKPEGSGLGLSTVYGIVKQSGGYVWVDAGPGRGTTITVHLPRWEGPLDEAPAPVASPPSGGAETILVVEDQNNLRGLICEVLEDAGYRVLSAADGRSALDLSDGHPQPIHLLLTDVVMPGMSGSQLAETLRAHRPETRTLLMSGYPNEVIERSGGPGDLPLLEKPFSRAKLLERVRETLSPSRA